MSIVVYSKIYVMVSVAKLLGDIICKNYDRILKSLTEEHSVVW